jgi:hypothetical protein
MISAMRGLAVEPPSGLEGAHPLPARHAATVRAAMAGRVGMGVLIEDFVGLT